ncbi:MAG TPA: hypothetical protein VI542_00810 [Candidatus Tectomicrobia bacterium]
MSIEGEIVIDLSNDFRLFVGRFNQEFREHENEETANNRHA